jgi:hypothetical protein
MIVPLIWLIVTYLTKDVIDSNTQEPTGRTQKVRPSISISFAAAYS